MTDPRVDPLSRAFAALADPTRRDMVARLAVEDATVGELAAPYQISLQAVSKHLKVLEAAGLVTRSRDAQRRPVHLDADVLNLMTKWIERYQRAAEERYQRLDAVLADLDVDGNPLPAGRAHATPDPTPANPTPANPAPTNPSPTNPSPTDIRKGKAS